MLTSQKLIEIQTAIILSSDLEEDRGTQGCVRDYATLEYIVEKEGYIESSLKKAAWLLYSIAVFHPFYQGNKRTALVTSEIVLQLGATPAYYGTDEDTIASFVIEISKYSVPLDEIEEWIRKNMKKM